MWNPTRVLTLAAGIASVFAAVVLILYKALPGPHGALDYLVIGTAATLTSLLALFLILLKTWVKDPEVFYRRRRR